MVAGFLQLETGFSMGKGIKEKKWWQDFYSWKRDSLWVRV
jgi:hypothetical protein